jgi:hypothetical protein
MSLAQTARIKKYRYYRVRGDHMAQQQPPQGQQIQVAFPDQMKGGVYSNNAFISHTKEEFIMDFMMIGPNAGAVTARVITSPGHMKRIILALQDNVRKYEEKFGRISEAEEPGKGHIGFN